MYSFQPSFFFFFFKETNHWLFQPSHHLTIWYYKITNFPMRLIFVEDNFLVVRIWNK